ncbi:MAG: 30S ribosomal protein S7 [Parcubacteria group bacterium SW_6_46_9]|nr:MAG: 30S ribosomal protein S7 [Parcubacteria group bacterium SW_6_46_9]
MANYPITQRHPIKPDYKYESQEVAKFINYVMTGGRKDMAREIVYDAFDIIAEKTDEDALDVFEEALENVGPYMEVRSRRIGGATYQVPYEVDAKRRLQLSLRWLKDAAQSSQSSEGIEEALAREIIKASNEEGAAFQRKEQAHKMADANKAFAHFAR